MSTTFYTLNWTTDKGHRAFIDTINTPVDHFCWVMSNLSEDGTEFQIFRSSPEAVTEVALEDFSNLIIYNGAWEPVAISSL